MGIQLDPVVQSSMWESTVGYHISVNDPRVVCYSLFSKNHMALT